MKQENALKAACIRLLREKRPDWVIIPHQEVREHGTPDISVTGNTRTTWWEFKHGTPAFLKDDNQELKCARLAREGFCRYIVYREGKDGLDRMTCIFHPLSVIHTFGRPDLHKAESIVDGFNHHFVTDYIIFMHRKQDGK